MTMSPPPRVADMDETPSIAVSTATAMLVNS